MEKNPFVLVPCLKLGFGYTPHCNALSEKKLTTKFYIKCGKFLLIQFFSIFFDITKSQIVNKALFFYIQYL
jgi:hypothetical protein